MILSPSRNNIEISLIQEWAIKATGDTGYAVFPFLRNGVVMIEALFDNDTQQRPDPYAYQLTASAEFLPVFSLLNNTNLLLPLSVSQIEHRIQLGGGGYVMSAPLNSTPSPSGFGVKWKFCSDHESTEACYLLMEIQRRLTPAEFLQVTTSANVDTTAAVSSDTFYLFSTFSRQDIIPAGVAQFELGATSALGNVVEYIRDTKYEAELQTVEDERGQFTSQGTIKIDFECEPMETQETELQKWPTLVGQANYSKVTFIGGLTAVLSTNLGINFDYVSASDMQDIAHGKIVASGVVTVNQFISIMEVIVASQWGGSSGTALPGNSTSFLSPFCYSDQSSGNEAIAKIPVTRPGTFSNLIGEIYRATANASSVFTVTVRKNGVDMALLCAIPSANASASQASDSTHSFTVIKGDSIDIKVVGDGSGNGCDYLAFNMDFTQS